MILYQRKAELTWDKIILMSIVIFAVVLIAYYLIFRLPETISGGLSNAISQQDKLLQGTIYEDLYEDYSGEDVIQNLNLDSDESYKNSKVSYVKDAYQEYKRWDSGELKETDSKAKDFLQDYWDATPRGTDYEIPKTPWSAAFISFVVRDFSSASHAGYVNPVYHERMTGWKFYEPEEREIEVGDIVCNTRAGDDFDPNNPEGYAAHCDIVVSVSSASSARVIGGNVDDSVTARSLALSQGKVSNSNYFGVLVQE